jgi:signal transduction histidine kinase
MEKGGKLTIISREQNGFVEIAFKDTGCGIPKENLAKIFEPLFSTKAKGTGLGLSVCRSLVEGHNGKIEVESEAGKGTTFRVKLPIKRR